MNLTTLTARTRALIQEAVARRWTDPAVLDALNNRYFEAQDAVNRIRPGYFDTGALINLSANVTNYARPFFKPVRGYYRLAPDGAYVECKTYSFETVTPSAEHEISRIFLPGVFAVAEMGPIILVYPTPTANLTSGLKVLSDYDISLSAPTDVPRLMPSLHWRLASGAAAELLDSDPTASDKAKAKLRFDFDWMFAMEPDSLKRLARVYSERKMSTLTMEPPTNVLTGQFRRLLNGGTTIIYGA